jgi:hypothetical protein
MLFNFNIRLFDFYARLRCINVTFHLPDNSYQIAPVASSSATLNAKAYNAAQC